MMKRTGVPRLGPDDPPTPLPNQGSAQMQQQQAGASNLHAISQQQQQQQQPQLLGTTAMLPVSGGSTYGRGPRQSTPNVISYMKSGVQYAPVKPPPAQRHKQANVSLSTMPPTPERQVSASPAAPPSAQGHQTAPQFQRLKVEDALSYLDQVKYKFNMQPQVYNDFLDIMKEFKSQTIDTPGVITRVSNLFKGHSELIVGFNTFLPPGYKIEVQSNGQVSVSMPSPSGVAGVAGGVSSVANVAGVASVANVAVSVGSSGVLLGVHHQPPQPQLVHLLPVPQTGAIVHNLSVNPAPQNTLHHISQAHQQIESAAAVHHAQGGGIQQNVGATHNAPAGQPVEFNHAIEYVNKIKSRFIRQPEKYKRFLEILHAYQRGHRDVKEPQAKLHTEQEVYAQVAKLFESQDDLLAEFGQFLPDAKAVVKAPHYPPHARTPPLVQTAQRAELLEPQTYGGPPSPPPITHPPLVVLPHQQVPKIVSNNTPTVPVVAPVSTQSHHLKRSPSFSSNNQLPVGAPPPKKSRVSALTGPTVRDVSYAEASKYGTQLEYSFFDKVRKVLKSQQVYDNFLRCILLFTNEIISGSELVCVTAPFLRRHGALHAWLRRLAAPTAPPAPAPACAAPPAAPSLASLAALNTQDHAHHEFNSYSTNTGQHNLLPQPLSEAPIARYESLGPLGAQMRHDRPTGDQAMDVDLTTCKRLGTSYCALPREAAARKCSGRTSLCKEVLNDTWVSFPTWSEDSTFVTSRKTQYEEYIYRCEDERFELDVVIETNAATIRVLEGVQKKLSRMTAEEAAKYRLDDCLGGHSPTIHQRALRRIYGDKVAVDIIAGLKKNPVVAVPVVLRRLKAKEEEWREAQKGFNKQWREQNEKYYLKSLDHQGINFKQNDLKAMRSKTLFNEIESAYEAGKPPPHLFVDYNCNTRQDAIKIFRDASDLLIHHARRQTAIQKAEKRRIKQLLRHFLPDLFNHPRQQLSDDENEEEKEDSGSAESPSENVAQEDKSSSVKQEKPESSESDNASDKSSRNKNDKENKPKNVNTNNDLKESTNLCNVKRSSSNEDSVSLKADVKTELQYLEDDIKDNSATEAEFVCTPSWYLFLRLHALLCSRLALLRAAALRRAAAERGERAEPSAARALRLKPNNLPVELTSVIGTDLDNDGTTSYRCVIELVRGVLDGGVDANAYEDAARELLGVKAYPAYTLDKLVCLCVRQLQHCVTDVWSCRVSELQSLSRGGLRGPYARAKARAAHRTLHSRSQAAFRTTILTDVERERVRVGYQLLGAPAEAADAGSREPVRRECRNKPVFLRRNAQRCGWSGRECSTTGSAAPSFGVARVTQRRRKPAHLMPTHHRLLGVGLGLVWVKARRGKSLDQQPSRTVEMKRLRIHRWLQKMTRNLPHIHTLT